MNLEQVRAQLFVEYGIASHNIEEWQKKKEFLKGEIAKIEAEVARQQQSAAQQPAVECNTVAPVEKPKMSSKNAG